MQPFLCAPCRSRSSSAACEHAAARAASAVLFTVFYLSAQRELPVKVCNHSPCSSTGRRLTCGHMRVRRGPATSPVPVPAAALGGPAARPAGWKPYCKPYGTGSAAAAGRARARAARHCRCRPQMQLLWATQGPRPAVRCTAVEQVLWLCGRKPQHSGGCLMLARAECLLAHKKVTAAWLIHVPALHCMANVIYVQQTSLAACLIASLEPAACNAVAPARVSRLAP